MNSILFLLRSFSVGGAERQLCVLALGLQQKGYSVKVAVIYTGGALEAEARKMGLQVVDLKRKGRWDLIPFFFRLIRLVKSEKPDILHSYLQVPNIWSAFVKILQPRTKVVWGVRSSDIKWKDYGLQWQLTDMVESLLRKIPDWIILNSHAGLLHHAKLGYPSQKMSVVHNGIDTRAFFPDRKLGHALRAQWGIRDNQKLIGMAARVDPVKDYPAFLRAASLLLQARQDVRFVCVGGGSSDYVRECRELAASLNLDDFLIWAGERADMLNVYNAFDILVLSSVSEGVSNVIGEAMACGVPCVVTDVGDSAQLVGSLGEIVPSGDSEALKQGVLIMLDRLANDEELSERLSQRIIEQFSIAKLVSRTVTILDEVAKIDGVNRPAINFFSRKNDH
ncbi:MAG TPA: glycosyltransferase [Anaerolineales bacterium]|nr:glycosyltransferase [Anaerolineales bacterium]